MTTRNPADDPRMVAITLRQPWAALILQGGKTYENRGFRPGDWLLGREMAIHAGKEIDKRWCEVADEHQGDRIGAVNDSSLKFSQGLLGLVTVKGWIDNRKGRPKSACQGRIIKGGLVRNVTPLEVRRAAHSPWTEEGAVWWLLEGARHVATPLAHRGWPGLFRLDLITEARLRAALVEE